MRAIFIISDINEARIIRGISLGQGIESRIYASVSETIGEKEADIVVADRKIVGDESLKLIFPLSSKFIFILPFWMDAAEEVRKLRDIAEKLGFRRKKIKVIKRPLTTEELINYTEKIF